MDVHFQEGLALGGKGGRFKIEIDHQEGVHLQTGAFSYWGAFSYSGALLVIQGALLVI